MIGLDTNVLIRYIVRDDARQAAIADELIDKLTPTKPGYVTLLVLAELWWVLGSSYTYTADQRRELVEALLTAQELRIESTERVRAALERVTVGADFPDALIAQSAKDAGCSVVMTFDAKAAKRAGMRLVA